MERGKYMTQNLITYIYFFIYVYIKQLKNRFDYTTLTLNS